MTEWNPARTPHADHTYAEYVAAHAGSTMVVWFRGLLEELGFEQASPTALFMNNTAAEQFIRNHVPSNRTKHVDVKFHYVRERFERGYISVSHVSTRINWRIC